MRDRIKLTAAFLPVLALITVFYFYPLLRTLRYSMERGGEFIGLERYASFLSDSAFIGSTVFTVEIAAASTVISMVLATVVALALRDTFAGKRLSLFLFQTNISIPHIAVATMVLFLLAQTGLVSALFYDMGWISNWPDFPKLVEGVSPAGVIISYCLKFIPFVGMAVLAVLQSLPRESEYQSRTLGIGKLRTFWHITLPSILPAVASASMIVFAYSFGCYEVPAVLVRKQTLSTLVYNRYYDYYNPDGRPEAYAAAMVVAAVTITVSALYLYITGRREAKR